MSAPAAAVAAPHSAFDLDPEVGYTDLDRELDRALCQQYLRIWLRFQGTPELDEQPLTFAQFEAAADRLAVHAR